MRCVLPSLALAVLMAPPLAGAAEPAFLLWSVAGTHNTVYLLGSVHLLPEDALAWPATIEHAYDDAEKLVFEIDLDDLDPLEVQRVMLEFGRLPAGETLESALGAALFADMARHARALGLDAQRLQPFRPWVAALTLVQAQMNTLGLSRESGVEQRFLTRAVADRKDVLGLESPEEGLAALASLSSSRQREFMAYTLAEADTMATELDAMMHAWQRGDTARLAMLLEDGFRQFPDLYEPLTVSRNRRWRDALIELLDDQDDYLVIVGALHLVGEDSLIDLLEAQGRTVVRH